MTKKVFFFGMGYSAHASALALAEHAAFFAGTTRSPARAEALQGRLIGGRAVTAHVFSGDAPGPTLGADLADASHIIVSIAPDAAGDAVLNQHRADLDAAKNLQWLCYYSTIGVYGDFGGAWIDEQAPCVPANPRSQRRLAAEAEWRTYAAERGLPLTILRLGGIYGPGRSSFDKLAAGSARRIVKPGQVFNRIHVDDIARVTALAALRRLNGTFNLGDDVPAPPQDVVTYAAAISGMEPPPEVAFAQAEMTPMARSFYADNKRVSNAAIKAALEIELLYPSYREGLAAIRSGDAY